MKENLRSKFDDAVRAKESGDLRLARDRLLDLRRTDPESAAILAVLGDVCWAMNHFDEAIQFFREATTLQPQSEGISLALFTCLWRADRIDEAFDEMRRFLWDYESEEYTKLVAKLKEPQITRH